MKKEEIIYREIANAYSKDSNRFTQLGLAKNLGISLSTVNNAISNLERINAVKISKRSFSVSELDRLLLYWATHRNLDKDVFYTTHVNEPVREIERSMPDGIAFTAYTAYKLNFGDVPADYSEVYVYAAEDSIEQIKRRFKKVDGFHNLIVLKADYILEKYIKEGRLKHSSVPIGQAFVDLWNIKTWYAKEFADALENRLLGE